MDPSPTIDLVRLTTVPAAEIRALLNEPRNRRHMPLANDMSVAEVANWVRDKDAQWDRHGYGPWAIMIDGAFAGWGGFQAEEGGADLAVVLAPACWGHGAAVAREMIRRGFEDLALSSVLIALPLTRSPERVVARLGFRPDGEVSYGGARFRQFRLDHADWRAASAGR